MTKTYIIILNYNGGGETAKCLESTIAEGKRLGWRGLNVLVVDNGSTDKSLNETRALIRKYQLASRIKVIENNKNLGFAAGNNVGIKYALRKGAKRIMLLNQDTLALKGFLMPLVESKAGIVAPVIRFKRKKRWIYDHGGKVNWWNGRTSHIEKLSNWSNGRYSSWKKGQEMEKVDYVSGCAMMVKSEVFEKVGLLDEKYFLYFEDADFCLRAQKAGFKVAVESASMITHKLTEGKAKPLAQRLEIFKSNLRFINSHISVWRRPIAYSYLRLVSVKLLLGL